MFHYIYFSLHLLVLPVVHNFKTELLDPIWSLSFFSIVTSSDKSYVDINYSKFFVVRQLFIEINQTKNYINSQGVTIKSNKPQIFGLYTIFPANNVNVVVIFYVHNGGMNNLTCWRILKQMMTHDNTSHPISVDLSTKFNKYIFL